MHASTSILTYILSHMVSEIQLIEPLPSAGFGVIFHYYWVLNTLTAPFSNSKDGSGRRKSSVPVLVFFQGSKVFILPQSQLKSLRKEEDFLLNLALLEICSMLLSHQGSLLVLNLDKKIDIRAYNASFGKSNSRRAVLFCRSCLSVCPIILVLFLPRRCSFPPWHWIYKR